MMMNNFRWTNGHFSQFRGKKMYDIFKVGDARDDARQDYLSYRSPVDNSETSSNWRKTSVPVPVPVPGAITTTETETTPPVVTPPVTATPIAVSDAQTFRHYRSRHWKSNYRNKEHHNGGRKRVKCRHSYGIICRRAANKSGATALTCGEAQYLAQHRRHSIGMVEMVRSNWNLLQVELIESLCGDMSEKERAELADITNFPRLWLEMCLDENKKDYSSPYFLAAEKKLRTLLAGYYPEKKVTDNSSSFSSASSACSACSASSAPGVGEGKTTATSPVTKSSPIPATKKSALSTSPVTKSTLSTSPVTKSTLSVVPVLTASIVSWAKICASRTTHYDKPALEFPKGRRNKNSKESHFECAKREFLEETNIKPEQYTILNVPPLREVFTGINGYRYIYVYYLAEMKNEDQGGGNDALVIDPSNLYQVNEVSEIKWCKYEELLSLLRPRDLSRICVFKEAHAVFEELVKNKISL